MSTLGQGVTGSGGSFADAIKDMSGIEGGKTPSEKPRQTTPPEGMEDVKEPLKPTPGLELGTDWEGERRRKIEITSDAAGKGGRRRRDLLSTSYFRPGYRLRWLNTNKLNIEQKRMDGYELVRVNRSEAPETPFETEKNDGYIRVGDMILAEIPEAVYQQHEQERFETTQRRSTAIDNQLRSEARKQGVQLDEGYEAPGKR